MWIEMTRNHSMGMKDRALKVIGNKGLVEIGGNMHTMHNVLIILSMGTNSSRIKTHAS